MNTDDPMLVEQIWPIAGLLSSAQTTIVVAGAWKGLYLHYFAQRFPNARVVGFEPQAEAFIGLKERIFKNKLTNAEVHPYGLGLANQHITIGSWGSDGASFLSAQPPFNISELRDAQPILYDLEPISLFVMNMEGYEYLLLPYLIGTKLLHRIDSLAIQFHPKFFNFDLRFVLRQQYGESVYDDPDWTYWKCQP